MPSSFDLHDDTYSGRKSAYFDAAKTDYNEIMRVSVKQNVNVMCTYQDQICNKDHCNATTHSDAPSSLHHSQEKNRHKLSKKKRWLSELRKNHFNYAAGRFDGNRLWQGNSVFEMDFKIFKGVDFGMSIFVVYAVLVFLVMVKVATIPPHRIANMKIQ
jgi:hypothetical protein